MDYLDFLDYGSIIAAYGWIITAYYDCDCTVDQFFGLLAHELTYSFKYFLRHLSKKIGKLLKIEIEGQFSIAVGISKISSDIIWSTFIFP